MTDLMLTIASQSADTGQADVDQRDIRLARCGDIDGGTLIGNEDDVEASDLGPVGEEPTVASVVLDDPHLSGHDRPSVGVRHVLHRAHKPVADASSSLLELPSWSLSVREVRQGSW